MKIGWREQKLSSAHINCHDKILASCEQDQWLRGPTKRKTIYVITHQYISCWDLIHHQVTISVHQQSLTGIFDLAGGEIYFVIIGGKIAAYHTSLMAGSTNASPEFKRMLNMQFFHSINIILSPELSPKILQTMFCEKYFIANNIDSNIQWWAYTIVKNSNINERRKPFVWIFFLFDKCDKITDREFAADFFHSFMRYFKLQSVNKTVLPSCMSIMK